MNRETSSSDASGTTPAGASPWRRLLPAPGLALALWVTWLMLAGSASLGQMLLGALLALPLAAWAARLTPAHPGRKHPTGPATGAAVRTLTLLRLGATVARDIVVSNVDVARRVLGPEAAIRSRWVELPLQIRDERGIAALASIITLTPGTLSAEISDDQRRLRVHALHVDDDAAEAAMVADIRARYEAPLRVIVGEVDPAAASAASAASAPGATPPGPTPP